MIKSRLKGYTLVRMAELLVTISLVGILIFHLTTWWHDHERASFLQSLKELETLAWQYRDNYGKWPIECDSNPIVTTADQSIKFIFKRDSLLDEGLNFNNCEETKENYINLEVVSTDSSLTSRKVTLDKLSNSTKFVVGAINEKAISSQLNSVFAFNVPLDLANWLDREIDGQSADSHGRIRFWSMSDNNEYVLLGYIIETRI